MKMLYIIAVILLAVVAATKAQSEPRPMDHPRAGVYAIHGMFQTRILELNNGRFRYWFRSDAKVPVQEPSYPVTGPYIANGGFISFTNEYGTLRMPDGQQQQLTQTNLWRFMMFRGQPTLWSVTALDSWTKRSYVEPYGVLYSTKRRTDEFWTNKVFRR